MNMMNWSPVDCPYCRMPLFVRWPRGMPVHWCRRCGRPLVRYPAPRAPMRYRVVSVFAVVKVYAAIMACLTLFGFVVLRMPLAAIASQVALLLGLLGTVDLTDGLLGLLSRIDSTARRVRTGSQARRVACGKMVLGAVNCTVAIVGLVALWNMGQDADGQGRDRGPVAQSDVC